MSLLERFWKVFIETTVTTTYSETIKFLDLKKKHQQQPNLLFSKSLICFMRILLVGFDLISLKVAQTSARNQHLSLHLHEIY